MPTAFGQQPQHHAFDRVVMPVQPRFWGQRSSHQVFGAFRRFAKTIASKSAAFRRMPACFIATLRAGSYGIARGLARNGV
jgi:hypothetical protein